MNLSGYNRETQKEMLALLLWDRKTCSQNMLRLRFLSTEVRVSTNRLQSLINPNTDSNEENEQLFLSLEDIAGK